MDINSFLKKEDPEQLYELLAEIGQGSFGAVYKAKNKANGSIVAIKKMIHNGDTESEEWLEIMKEIRFISLLDHENCLKHYGSYIKGNTVWMVMEFCLGSAADMLEVFKKPLKEEEIAAIMSKVLLAIKYLHDNRRIHRDLKAANILLTSQGKVKLGDFGTASMSDPANTFVGTPCWMAPEVILAMESGLYTQKADIWSFGITCIELAEKRPPLFEMNTMSALYHIPQNDPPRLQDTQAWSPVFQDFVAKCLVKSWGMRPSADDLLQHPFLAGDPKVHQKVLRALVRRSKQAAADIDEDRYNKMEKLLHKGDDEHDGDAAGESAPAATIDSNDSTPRPEGSLYSPELPTAPPSSSSSPQQSSAKPAALAPKAIKPTVLTNLIASSGSPMTSTPLTPEVGTPKTLGEYRQRSSSAVDKDDDDHNTDQFNLSSAAGAAANQSHNPDINMDGSTIKPQRRDVEKDQEKLDARAVIKGQLKLFQALQTQQQKQLKQLEKAQEVQRADLKRQSDRQLEQEMKNQQTETDKLSSKHKQTLSDANKGQASALKTFTKEQSSRHKAALKEHLNDQSKVVKEMEKGQKESRHKLAKNTDPRKTLKESQLKELMAFKTQADEKFMTEQKAIMFAETKAFREKQLDELQATELKLFTEMFEKKRSHKELAKTKRLQALDAEQRQLLEQQREMHELQATMQAKLQQIEMEQLEETQKKEEKDLRKRHINELKMRPKQFKSIQSTMKREMTQTMKMTKQRHSVIQKQMLDSAPRDMHKKIVEEQKKELEREITETSADFERKINNKIERETIQLDMQQTKREEELLVQQTKEHADLEGYQKLRRTALTATLLEERDTLVKKNEEARLNLERTLETEFVLFVDNNAEQRAQLIAKHTQERETLKDQINASMPASMLSLLDGDNDVSSSNSGEL